jgi:hypothetical protein
MCVVKRTAPGYPPLFLFLMVECCFIETTRRMLLIMASDLKMY